VNTIELQLKLQNCRVAAPLPILARSDDAAYAAAIEMPHLPACHACAPRCTFMHSSTASSVSLFIDPAHGIQAQFREGLGSPELLVRTPDGALAPLSGPVPVPEVAAGSKHTVVVYMGVTRPGQLQLAAQLTCTLNSVRGLHHPSVQ